MHNPLKLSLSRAKQVQRDFKYLEQDKPKVKYDGNEYNWVRLLVVPTNYADLHPHFLNQCCDLFFRRKQTIFEVEGISTYTIIAMLKNNDNSLRVTPEFISIVSTNNIDFTPSDYQ